MKKILLSIVITILFASCSNYVHDLIPPPNKEIISCGLKNAQMQDIDCTEYRDKQNITLTVAADTDITKLIPVIKVSDGASIMPITLEYLNAAFPSMDLLTFAVKLQEAFSSDNVKEWVFDFIRENPDFRIPSLSLPVNFSQPVYFLVISGRAATNFYKIEVQKMPSSGEEEENPTVEKPEESAIYTVMFDSNDDTNRKYTQTFVSGKEQKLNYNRFSRASYVFKGWNTEKDGSGTFYSDEQPISITSDMTLYAQWIYVDAYQEEPAQLYTITFASNDGRNKQYTQTFISQKEQNLNHNCFFYTDYIFDGWNTKPDGSGTFYSDEQPISITSDMTLYAQWSPVAPVYEKNITFFAVAGQQGEAEIYENTVEFSVDSDVDISALYPVVKVSPEATVLPLTQKYLLSLGLTFEQILSFYSGYSTSTNIEAYIANWLTENDIQFPQELSIPIDFRETVVFAVVGADKTVKLYRIKCNVLKIDPVLEKVVFTKYNNSGLMKDCIAWKDSEVNFVAYAVYPVEYGDFGLIPEFTYYGDKVTYQIGSSAETDLISGETKIPFTAYERKCTVTVYKGSNKAVYTIEVDQSFDPDTIRSITDFRFWRPDNPDIKQSVVASIADEGDFGYITVTVNYDGAKPDILIPYFYSPGTVSVDYIQQSSGVSSQNFSTPVEYLCVSKDKQFSRLYTVNVEFNKVEPATALINSFSFPMYLNKDISYDAKGFINDANSTIDIEVPYSSATEPYNLMPIFSGTGKIYVDGIMQTSGYSEQDFSNNVYYKVVAADDESVTKLYTVRTLFKKDTDSLCEITSFSFKKSTQNDSLSENVNASVTQRTQEIFAYLPYGSGSREKPLAATFEAEGNVYVDGELQTSGVTLNDFSGPVTYKVISENGKYEKEYTVCVQESGSIIYVNNRATGHNNGSTWDDAYMSLETALASAESVAGQVPCEIWICDNTDEYVAENPGNKLAVGGIISVKGGFAGTETNAAERDASKKTKLKGFSISTKQQSCELYFENIEMIGIDGENSGIYTQQNFSDNLSLSLDNVAFSGNTQIVVNGATATFNMTDCLLQNTDIALDNGSLNVADTTFDACEISGEIEYTEIANSTFNGIKLDTDGKTQSFDNCKFIDSDTTATMAFKAEETNISGCNFDDFAGEVNSEYSTFIKSKTTFAQNTKILVANAGSLNIEDCTMDTNYIEYGDDGKNLKASRAVFNNCEISGDIENTEIANSTFNGIKLDNTGETQSFDNCKFIDSDTTATVAFKAEETNISAGDFRGFAGDVICEYSTFLKNKTAFAKNGKIKVANAGSLDINDCALDTNYIEYGNAGKSLKATGNASFRNCEISGYIESTQAENSTFISDTTNAEETDKIKETKLNNTGKTQSFDNCTFIGSSASNLDFNAEQANINGGTFDEFVGRVYFRESALVDGAIFNDATIVGATGKNFEVKNCDNITLEDVNVESCKIVGKSPSSKCYLVRNEAVKYPPYPKSYFYLDLKTTKSLHLENVDGHSRIIMYGCSDGELYINNCIFCVLKVEDINSDLAGSVKTGGIYNTNFITDESVEGGLSPGFGLCCDSDFTIKNCQGVKMTGVIGELYGKCNLTIEDSPIIGSRFVVNDSGVNLTVKNSSIPTIESAYGSKTLAFGKITFDNSSVPYPIITRDYVSSGNYVMHSLNTLEIKNNSTIYGGSQEGSRSGIPLLFISNYDSCTVTISNSTATESLRLSEYDDPTKPPSSEIGFKSIKITDSNFNGGVYAKAQNLTMTKCNVQGIYDDDGYHAVEVGGGTITLTDCNITLGKDLATSGIKVWNGNATITRGNITAGCGFSFEGGSGTVSGLTCDLGYYGFTDVESGLWTFTNVKFKVPALWHSSANYSSYLKFTNCTNNGVAIP